MICKMCNSENSEASKFCGVCGAKLEEAAPAAAPMFCSSCGSALGAGTKFCPTCGAAVGAAPVEQPVPVMTAASAASAPMAAPTPVNEAPAPVSEVPVPAAVPTPVSEIPAPVNEVPAPMAAPTPVNSVPAPVNEASATGFGNAVAVQTAAPTAFGAGAAEVQPSFGNMSSNGPSELPVFEAGAAGAVAVKPVKKGGKKALKIILITLGALLIVAGVLYALFFREFFHPMFMGNQGYAAKVERSRTDVVMESEALENVTKKSGVLANSVVRNMMMPNNLNNTSANFSATLEAGEISAMVGEYYAMFMEMYGVNAVTVDLDADIDLSDAALSAMDIDDDEALKVIDYINSAEFKMTYATSKDAVGAFIEASAGDGFTINAKGIVYADGNVALMFPFGSDKCIKAKLNTSTGEVIESSEVEVDIDPAEVQRLTKAITDIYLKHYEKAETTIENGEVFIGGTSENATLKASGRLITVNMSSAALGEMLSEMITFFAEDQYFTDKIIEMAENEGAELSAVDYKNELINAANKVKSSVPFGLNIKTLVNFNGDVLGGAYTLSIPNQGAIGVKYIMNGNDCGFALTAMGMEVFNITVDAKNDTDGQIRLESSALSMGMSMAGGANMNSSMPTGINIDYKGVRNEKFFNSEVPVGTYDIYLAGTAASGPENSAFRIHIEDKVEGSSVVNSFKAEYAEYGSISLNMKSTAHNDNELLTIPSDAYDCGNMNNVTTDQARAAGEYLLSMINDIQAACDGSSSAIAQALAPKIESLADSLEHSLVPMADHSAVITLSTNIDDLMFTVLDTYEENEDYISDELEEEMGKLYSKLEDLYDDVYGGGAVEEIPLADYEHYEDIYESCRIEWNGLERKVKKAVENGGALAGNIDVDLVGTWKLYECDVYGVTYPAEDLDLEYIIMLNKNGTMKMSAYGESAEGVWSVDGDTVVITEITETENYVNEFKIHGDILMLEDLGVSFKFKK